MANPIGDYTHELASIKGWPAMQPLDFNGGQMATNDAASGGALAGRAVSLNSSGNYTLGVVGFQPPMFLLRGTTSFDVATSAHNSYGVAVMPRGNLSSLVGFGALELTTTEFDTTKTYAPGDALKSPQLGQITPPETTFAPTSAGLLFKTRNWPGGSNAAFKVVGVDASGPFDTIIGMAAWGQRLADGAAVTGPAYTSPYRTSVLAFWPVFVPGSI
jgi:hypothetical protein